MEYEGLLKATMALTKDQRQMDEAFRRMAFNVFAHNRDDHVKNFSYLRDRSGEWRFAPAYDIVYSQGPGGEHTMAVAGEAARPTERDMLRVAEDCDVDSRRAREIIRQVRDTVNQWPRFALAMKVSDETASWIEKVIVGP
jgi:serine/threonine-protein kinase HipA